ncbi:MAG: energy-coupling factor transporter transmembrane protein EcfT [Candidatus Heimdallarchaeota archaeon]|nr:MAG: energy-coupling factor transporter transmembrane protein EcfT [Candidatus Heimdallarchaeota archaeon]
MQDNLLQEFLTKGHISGTNPLVKFLAVIVVSITLFGTSNLFKIYFIVLIIILVYIFGKLPFEVAKPRYKMMFLFSFTIFFVQILFVHGGNLFFYLIPLQLGEHGPFFPIYEHGFYQGLILIGRFWGLITISWLFINSTNPFAFAQSLTKIGIPYRFAFSLSLALRFAPVFSTETNIVQNAQQARGLNVNPNNLKGIFNLLKHTLIPMIGSTLNRIRDITISMDGRAFGSYTTRTYIREIPFTLLDGCKLIVLLCLLFILSIL